MECLSLPYDSHSVQTRIHRIEALGKKQEITCPCPRFAAFRLPLDSCKVEPNSPCGFLISHQRSLSVTLLCMSPCLLRLSSKQNTLSDATRIPLVGLRSDCDDLLPELWVYVRSHCSPEFRGSHPCIPWRSLHTCGQVFKSNRNPSVQNKQAAFLMCHCSHGERERESKSLPQPRFSEL